MRCALWPEEDGEELRQELDDFTRGEPPCFGLVAEAHDGRLIGFAEIAVRSYAEGCRGPAPYVEAIWVEPDRRRKGVGRALLQAAEDWAHEKGYAHIASDTAPDNGPSRKWHAAAGFEEVDRLIAYAKRLS
ncbi:MAG: GNAT family N-acetyltransferase [Sphingomonadaceae bacterium]